LTQNNFRTIDATGWDEEEIIEILNNE